MEGERNMNEKRIKIKDVAGTVYGRLTALENADYSNYNKTTGPIVKCQCDCGKIYFGRLYLLRRGSTK